MFLTKHFVTSAIHLGHQTNKWNPRMAYFLSAISATDNRKCMGRKAAIHIIDLEQTILMMRRAFGFIRNICANRGHIMCISSRETFGFSQEFTNGGGKSGARTQSTQSAVPQALFLLGAAPIKEAMKLQIPIVSVLDSNANPFGVEYPIPGNDDSVESRTLYIKWIQSAIVDGKKTEVQMFSS